MLINIRPQSSKKKPKSKVSFWLSLAPSKSPPVGETFLSWLYIFKFKALPSGEGLGGAYYLVYRLIISTITLFFCNCGR